MATRSSRFSVHTPLISTVDRAAIARWVTVVQPVWPAGLVAVSLLLAALVTHVPGLSLADRTRDWVYFLVAGAVMPLALLVAWSGRNSRLERLLAVSWPIVGVLLFAVTWRWAAIPLALLQWWSLSRMAPRLVANRETGLAVGAVSLGAWVIVLSLQPAAESGWQQIVAFLLVAVLVTPLTMAWVLDYRFARFRSRFPWGVFGNIIALAALAALSFRTDGLFSNMSAYGQLAWYHWGVFTGAADLVRQGGHLLWDVPAYYGFLDTLLVAYVPFGSAWQGLYLINALLTFAAAAAIFLALRGRSGGFSGWLIGFAGAVIACLLLKGFDELVPEHLTPAVGGIRYVWCFVLVGILLWERSTKPGGVRQSLALGTGLLAWLLGLFWSPESAAYCSIIWLPAYALIVIQRSLMAGSSRRATWGCAGTWLALPVLLCLGAVVAIGIVYQTTLGHLPDPVAYIDYVLGFGSGLVSAGYNEATNIDPVGSALVALLCVAAVLVLACDRRSFGNRNRDLPLLIALAGGIWGVSSYLVGRPYPTVIYRFLIFWLLAIGVSKLISSPVHEVGSRLFHRIMLAPVLVVIIAATLIDARSLTENLESLTRPAVSPLAIDDGIPLIDASLTALLTEAGVQPDDPIQFAGDPSGGLMKAWRPAGSDQTTVISYRGWLPTMPLTAFSPLTEDRKTTYIDRMSDRMKSGGWLIQRKENGTIDQGYRTAEQAGAWLFSAIARDHVLTRVYENDNWQVTWFAYVNPATDFRVPEFPDGMLPALPQRIQVDGVSLANHPREDVIAFWGTGWTIHQKRYQIPSVGLTVNRPEESVSFENSATLNVYSDAPRTISMAIESTNARRMLTVRENDKVLGALHPGAETGSALAIDLTPGWHVLTLEPIELATGTPRTIVTSIDFGVTPGLVATEAGSSDSPESESISGGRKAAQKNIAAPTGNERAARVKNRAVARETNVPAVDDQMPAAADGRNATNTAAASDRPPNDAAATRAGDLITVDRQVARETRQARDDRRVDPFQSVPPGPNGTVFEGVKIDAVGD